jgi:hypothetical protein
VLNAVLTVGAKVVLEKKRAMGMKVPDLSQTGADLAAELNREIFTQKTS